MKIHARLALGLVITVGLKLCSAQSFPPQFRGIGIEPRPGGQLPLRAVFLDEYGAAVHLGDYFRGKPVLLLPVYYTCTTLCGEALRGLVEGISPLQIMPGRDFEIVAFSINPSERPVDARKKLNDCTMNYNGRRGGPGWHFLTGDLSSIDAVTNAIGFHYRYEKQQRMFVHASGMMIASPSGHIVRYLLGVTYQPHDLEQAVEHARQNQLQQPTADVRLLCYPFATTTSRVNALAIAWVRGSAGLMLIGLTVCLAALWRFDLRRQRNGTLGDGS